MESDIPSTGSGGSRRKSVLVCPGCGHESPTDGDWTERRCETAGETRLALSCPMCRTNITYRPLPNDRNRERSATPTLQ